MSAKFRLWFLICEIFSHTIDVYFLNDNNYFKKTLKLKKKNLKEELMKKLSKKS